MRFVPSLSGLVRSRSTHFRLSGLGEQVCSIDPVTGGRVCQSGGPPIPTPVPIPLPQPPPIPITNQDDPAYPGWKSFNPPNGSYRQSCINIASDGAGNLWANCDNGAGQNVSTSLNYSACTSGAPYNQRGQLMCGGPGGSQVAAPANGPGPGVVPVPSPIPITSGGVPINPLTGQTYPVGTPINPATGQPYINPATGVAYPPGTLIDASTGYPVNPQTGIPYNPTTGLPISATPATIVSSPAYMPSPYVSTSYPTSYAAAPASTSSSIPWSKILIFGGIGTGALIILKMLGVIGKK